MSTPEPHNDRAEVVALRQPCENLLRSTLSFMQDLRDQGVVLPLHLRDQRRLVLIDGGKLDLAIDEAWPDVSDPGAVAARHQERLRIVAEHDDVAALYAAPLIDDEPYDGPDPRVSADRGGDILDRLRAHPLDADEMVDALERHQARGDEGLGAAA